MLIPEGVSRSKAEKVQLGVDFVLAKNIVNI